MASQAPSRKRPAPGTTPASFQQQMQPAANGYGGGLGPQLSDDQFLQWGQTAQPTNAFNDASTFSSSANNFGGNSVQPSNQLARRAVNLPVNRGRAYNDSNDLQWVDPANGNAQQLDSAWADDLDELEQKAQVVKKEAQAKRKQIPPFVQKLNRFVFAPANGD